LAARQETKEKEKSGEGKKHGKKNRGQGQPQQKDSQKTGGKKTPEKSHSNHNTASRAYCLWANAFGAIKNVKISKILAKTSVEDAETHPKAKKIDAKGRQSRQKEVSEKTKRKRKVRPRAKTWEEKRCFGWGT
jgi:hypothetical protein